MTIPQAFQTALQYHQSGRLAEAEALCRQILSVQASHADALHLLGVIALDVGRHDVAVDLIRRAVALTPHAAEVYCSLAEAHRQRGSLDEAIAAYRRVLELRPGYAEVHNNLGATLRAHGRPVEAIAEYRQAVQFKPGYTEAHVNLGNALRDEGRLEEAVAAYRQALQLQPGSADAQSNLAAALHLQGIHADQAGRSDVAVDLIAQAIAGQPHVAAYHSNLGEAYRKLGRIDEALAAYRRALELDPGLADALNNLGSVLKDLGRIEEAIAAYHRALEIRPGFAEAHSNLGNAFKELGRIEEAVAAYHRAIQFQPDLAEAHSNLGNALWAQDRADEAIAAYRRAIELKPGLADPQNNLGVALKEQGRLDEALAAYRRALDLQPGFGEPQWNTACLLLLRGDFEHGWPLFETRWEGSDSKYSKRNFPQPMWQGEALHGQRVLLHAEQGLGDTLQFIRYAPLVAQRGGQVIVECQPGLKTLLASLEGVAQIIEQGEPLPAFDLQIPLMSLPFAFGTRVETIPANIPYLHADPQKIARWRQRLEQETHPAAAADLSAPLVPSVLSAPSQRAPLKVGLVWAGGERPKQPKLRPLNRRRSLRLSQFAPLAAAPGVVFVSLQKGAPSAEAKTPPAGMRFVDWTGELADFADTAALIEALDLVISVDTAVAHLAGALGKPVWLLNRFDTCWRWFTEREDSPWYPTMRLFRQPRFLDWEPVLANVREQLAQRANEKSLSS